MSSTDPIQEFPPVTAADMAQHTEQALIELIYVGTGNQLLGTALGNLSSALNTTQSILNILQNLQTLHNAISVNSKSAFNFNYFFGPSSIWFNPHMQVDPTAGVPNGAHLSTRTPGPFPVSIPPPPSTRYTVHLHVDARITDYQRAYNAAASAYFGQAINPVFIFPNSAATGYGSYVSALRTLKSTLLQEINVLAAQSPAGAATDPNSLLATVTKVYNDLPANFLFSTVEKWALDNYNQHGTFGAAAGGALQNDLSTAITAAENLNDTQKEKVRRYLFIFQEYYQSASALLSSISQIIKQMAQHIAS